MVLDHLGPIRFCECRMTRKQMVIWMFVVCVLVEDPCYAVMDVRLLTILSVWVNQAAIYQKEIGFALNAV